MNKKHSYYIYKGYILPFQFNSELYVNTLVLQHDKKYLLRMQKKKKKIKLYYMLL